MAALILRQRWNSYDPTSNTWSPAGSLATARREHTMTLLRNGLVIVAGGANSVIGALNSAELYNPASNTWSAAGNLANARFRHTATLLPSGNVLVAGGPNGAGYLNSAELYDPVANNWTTVASLNTARDYAASALLPNGKVLVAGGFNNGQLNSAELFDPSLNTWSIVGNLATVRYGNNLPATLLPNGKVLVEAGGDGASNTTNTAELFDPASNTWSTGGTLAAARTGHTATLLNGGKVIVVGGQNAPGSYLASAEIYDNGSSYPVASQPVIFSFTQPLPNGGALTLTGTKFKGASESSGGSTNNSASNYPLVQIQSQATGQTAFLTPDPASPFSDSTYVSKKIPFLGTGPAQITVITNGIASLPVQTTISAAPTQINVGTITPGTAMAGNTITIPFTVTSTSGGQPTNNVVVGDGINATVVTAQSGTVSLALITAGLRTISLVYVGDANYAGSSTMVTYQVAPATPGFTNVAAANTARFSHTATLLPNGKVLVAGGIVSAQTSTNTAEIFDPATNTWSSAASMNTARNSHCATLMSNGSVLVAGGVAGTASLQSAEVYDPVNNQWTVVGSMLTARGSFTATLLPNGKVLAAGGSGATLAINSAELYDPVAQTWSAVASLGTARYYQTATLFPNGKVLVTGGSGLNGSSLLNAEIYDPAGNTWSVAGSMAAKRSLHTATLLSNGQVLAAGGLDPHAGTYLASAELYDPGTNTWKAAKSLGNGRAFHSATLLPNGKVIAAGGTALNGTVAVAEIYDPAADMWSSAGSLTTSRNIHTATLVPSGKVLLVLAGATTAGASLNAAEIYDVTNGGTWSTAGDMIAGRALYDLRVLNDGRVMAIGGGDQYTLVSINNVDIYNPTSGIWTATASMNNARRRCGSVVLPNGKVLVAGGKDSSDTVFLSSAELYDPVSSTWSYTGAMAQVRATVLVPLPNGKILATPGYDNSSGGLSACELYDPKTGTWSATGSLQTPENNGGPTPAPAILLPNGTVLLVTRFTAAIYDPVAGTWTPAAARANTSGEYTLTLLSSGKVLATGGSGGFATYNTYCEVYNPATGTWSQTGSMAVARERHTATILPDGRVLVAGGNTGLNTNSVEIYDPDTGTWTMAPSMAMAHGWHSAVLLPNGKVLVAGNDAGGVALGTGAELYDIGQQVNPAFKPVIATARSPLQPNTALTLTGQLFTGVSEASGGGVGNSPSNNPIVQLRCLANDQLLTLDPDPNTPWTATAYKSRIVTTFPKGPAALTVTVNGISSDATIINFNGNTTTTTLGTISPASPGIVSQVITVPFTVSGSGGTPTGNVVVGDGVTSVTVPVSAGMATLTFPTAGAHTIIAVYQGDFSSTGSSSAGAQYIISKAGTATVIGTIVPAQSVTGQQINVPFSINVNAPGTGTAASGNVMVTDGTTSATVPASQGFALLAFPDAGARAINVSYQGDADYNSSSANVNYTVNKADVTVTLGAVTPQVALTGESVTVPFTVVAASPGAGTPTGNVVVGDGVTSVTVLAGAGTATVNLANVGTRTLSAAYQGDLNFNAGSASTSYAVNKASTSISIGTITPANAVVGQTITIPFNVQVTAPGGGFPTGTVTVGDGITSGTADIRLCLKTSFFLVIMPITTPRLF